MSSPRSANCPDEGGFTLIEVLVAISITSLILVTMGFAVTQGFQNSATTSRSIDRAAVSNFASRYFSADIASSTALPTTHSPGQSNPSCGTGAAAGKSLIDIPAAGGTTIYYVVVGSASTGPNALYRRICQGSTTVSLQGLGQTNDVFNKAPSGAACNAATGVCTLTIAWSSPASSFTVTGTERQISG